MLLWCLVWFGLVGVNELGVTAGVTVGAATGGASPCYILSTPLYPITLLVSAFSGSMGYILEDQRIPLHDFLGFSWL